MGLKLIQIRKKEMKLTTEELADLSGVPVSTLNKILSGATQDPKLSTLRAIAEVLDLTLDDFDDTLRPRFVLSKAEQVIIETYRKADPIARQMVFRVLGIEYKNGPEGRLSESFAG